MAHVQDLLSIKTARIITISPDVTVYEAVARMNQHKIGALMVAEREETRVLVGIFTERDVLRRVVGQLRYPDLVSVGEVMSREPVTCNPFTSLDEAAATMSSHDIRHLPVVDGNGHIAGMISIGDLNGWNVHKAKHDDQRAERLHLWSGVNRPHVSAATSTRVPFNLPRDRLSLPLAKE